MVNTNYLDTVNSQSLLLGGIASIIFGILLLSWPGATLSVIMLLVGLWWLIQGIAMIFSIFLDRSGWIWKLLGGIIGIIAGIIVLQHPLQAAVIVPATLALILGILGMSMGIIAVIAAFAGDGWGTGILGIVSILIGLMFIFNAWVGAQVLVWGIALLMIISGITGIYWAYKGKEVVSRGTHSRA
ncbi:DUF308 domain-containing protein [Methanolobus sp.]|uniref:HdeD family acid-resistance protein n=1 Tax=Methanolobus sp. TaxID=1874737 RepID=UPI0025F5E6F0|nr:DUF308 domain-containing protein [Methanolobus sp.]